MPNLHPAAFTQISLHVHVQIITMSSSLRVAALALSSLAACVAAVDPVAAMWTLAGAPVLPASAEDFPASPLSAIGTNAHFSAPSGIVVAGDSAYIFSKANDHLRKMNLTTGNVSTIGEF